MIYLNGNMIAKSKAYIDPTDRGFLLGDGIFETMRADHGNIFYLAAHLNRLFSSAKFLEIDIPFTKKEITNGLKATLEANELTQTTASLRLTLTRGTGSRGLALPEKSNSTILITVAALSNEELPPANVIIASIPRNEYSPLSNIKSLNYLDNILARKEALANDADEAIMLNTRGNLAEATTANLFIVYQQHLFTPTLADGALPGITREAVIRISKEAKIMSIEKTLRLEMLLNADEVFLTNSLIRIRPVRKINGKIVGDGKPGIVTTKLSTLYNNSAKGL